MRRYEAVVILHPDMGEDDVRNFTERYTQLVKTSGGEIIKIEDWGLKRLAYLVQKKEKGRYILFDFVGLPALISEMERQFKISEDVMKYLSVKLDHDVDLEAFKTPPKEESEPVAEDAPPTEEAPATEETPAIAETSAEETAVAAQEAKPTEAAEETAEAAPTEETAPPATPEAETTAAPEADTPTPATPEAQTPAETQTADADAEPKAVPEAAKEGA